MPTNHEITELLSRLESAPARFASALARLEDADSVAQVEPGARPPAEVLAHARAAQDILEPRIYYILVRGGNTPLIVYDEHRWVEVARYTQLPLTELLAAMRHKRKELVHMLRNITPEEWDMTGTHEVKGPMSVFEIASFIADQDDLHLREIERAAGVRSSI